MGMVYRASDASLRIKQDVAIKVLATSRHFEPRHGESQEQSQKRRQRVFAQHTYILHREAQMSMQLLHNPKDVRYCPDGSSLIMRYLEDHTEFRPQPEVDLQSDGILYEEDTYDFSWYSQPTPLPENPYLVMELLKGDTLNKCLTRSLGFDEKAKKAVFLQTTLAVDYLESFGLIHRDIRPINLVVTESSSSSVAVKVTVIDLGHCICAKAVKQRSTSPVVHVRWLQDMLWAPPEVIPNSTNKGAQRERKVNFSLPTHSFDVYSLAVLALQLIYVKESKVQAAIAKLVASERCLGQMFGFPHADKLLHKMLGPPEKRPFPRLIAESILEGKLKSGELKRPLPASSAQEPSQRRHKEQKRERESPDDGAGDYSPIGVPAPVRKGALQPSHHASAHREPVGQSSSSQSGTNIQQSVAPQQPPAAYAPDTRPSQPATAGAPDTPPAAYAPDARPLQPATAAAPDTTLQPCGGCHASWMRSELRSGLCPRCCVVAQQVTSASWDLPKSSQSMVL